VSVRTLVIPFYYGSRSGSVSGPVINYGSGSDFLPRYDSGYASQKVTVPTIPVPQRWINVLMVNIHYGISDLHIL
jgi:hypothetical protein